MRVAINGLGRIGRSALKVALGRSGVEVVAVNDLVAIENSAYLLKYDSVYGRFSGSVEAQPQNSKIVVNDRPIKYLSVDDPTQLPWKELDIDVVVESTGRFADHLGGTKHINAGARKVIISANAKDADISIVMGVNHEKYNPSEHHIVANCSCTTNAAAPVLKVLSDSFTVRKALMTTIHGVTSTQNLVDGPNSDWRRGRAAFASIIPTTTGAAKAVSRVIPELEGRLTGMAYRVPVLGGSIVEVAATIAKETSAKEVNDVFRQAAKGDYKNIIEVSDEQLVSADILETTASAIIDSVWTAVVNFPDVKDENLIRVSAWYDNEYAYAVRLTDLMELVGR